MTAIRRIVRKLNQDMTPTQFIVTGYLGATVLATVLFLLPVSLKPGVKLTLLDALFTATSAISVTGLGVVNTADTFSVFGVFVLMLVLQFGGIGIMALGTFLWMVLGMNISLTYRRLIMIDQNRHNLSGLVSLIKTILGLALLFEGAGALLLSAYFLARGYYEHWYEAVYYAAFHAVSSYTNAGFDLFGSSMYVFASDYVVQTVTMLLLVLGAIGFPVLVEVREYLVQRRRNNRFRFSLYTKVTVNMFIILAAAGTAGIWIVESYVYLEGMSWHQKLFFSLFNSISTRSGGFATMDVANFSSPTQSLLSILMFIGASPSSVGGGIRTTTFAVLILTVISYAYGKHEVRVFRRSIKQEDVIKSFVVFSCGVMLVAGSTLLLDAVERQHFSLNKIIFEVCSAFGTSGLSTGITPRLSETGRVILIMLMFIGRVGILSLLFLFRNRSSTDKYHYPKEDLIIG